MRTAPAPMTAPALPGEHRTVETSAGTIHLNDTGAVGGANLAPTVVLVPGFLANGTLWRPIAASLHAAGFRVVAVDAPTGAHAEPMASDADLSFPGLARILGEVVDSLEASEVTVIANDSGCAVLQLLLTAPDGHPGKAAVTRAVFATGDFFEHFPPGPFKPLLVLPKVPGGVATAIKALHTRAFWQAPTSFGWLTNEPLPQDVRDAWLAPATQDKAVRRDLGKILSAFDASLTMQASERFGEVDVPVLFAWAADDKFFPPSDADRAAALLPNATVVKVPGARTFVMWDQPQAVVDAILAFHGDDTGRG